MYIYIYIQTYIYLSIDRSIDRSTYIYLSTGFTGSTTSAPLSEERISDVRPLHESTSPRVNTNRVNPWIKVLVVLYSLVSGTPGKNT